jgi:tetratricopeptide (TPR) repeat protein
MSVKTVCLILMLGAQTSFAQYNNKVYNLYLDFNEAQHKQETTKAFLKADSILQSPEKLPAKAAISFYARLAKLYEDQQQPEKAVIYNEKVVAAVPDYYVSHRALGYLYLLPLNGLMEKINSAKNKPADYEKFRAQYFKQIKTALPHLEKAEACDHDEQTLALIKSLYQKMNDQQDLSTLSKRLELLKAHCIDLLTD